MARVRVLILRSAGANCDLETEHAWRLAGAEPARVHVRRLIERPETLDEFQILTIPGGFSYGDDIAAGTILSLQLTRHLSAQIGEFVDRGNLVLGICNGFQVLVKAGLLPGRMAEAAREHLEPAGQAVGNPGGTSDSAGGAAGGAAAGTRAPAFRPGYATPFESTRRTCTITANDAPGFQDRWICLRAEDDRCPFLEAGRVYEMPIAHGEGRVTFDSPASRDLAIAAGHAVLRYVPCDDNRADARGVGQASSGASSAVSGAGHASSPDPSRDRKGAVAPECPPSSPHGSYNPNGSEADIAGMCDETGRILGLMPHPERFVAWTQHPCWTSLPRRDEGDGLSLFRRAAAFLS